MGDKFEIGEKVWFFTNYFELRFGVFMGKYNERNSVVKIHNPNRQVWNPKTYQYDTVKATYTRIIPTFKLFPITQYPLVDGFVDCSKPVV